MKEGELGLENKRGKERGREKGREWERGKGDSDHNRNQRIDSSRVVDRGGRYRLHRVELLRNIKKKKLVVC